MRTHSTSHITSEVSSLASAPSTGGLPEPVIEYCGECDAPLVPTCADCGEYSHDAIRRGKTWELRPIAHPECDRSLGWIPARECEVCEGYGDGEAVAAWRDQTYGRGNW